MEFLDQTIFYLGGEAVRSAQLLWAAFFVVAGVVVALWGSTYVSRHLLWKGTNGPEAARLIVSAMRWKAFGVGLLAAAAALGLNVLPVVWIILGLAAIVALALRETYGQIWSGVLLLWERPFALGERITVGDYEGEVEGLGLRATYLRSEDRLQTIVPNSYVATHTITNWSRTEGGLRVCIPVDVAPGADSGAVIAALRKAAERNSRVRKSPSPKAFLLGFGSRGMRYELIVWVSNYTERPWVINELCRAIDSEFQRDRIAMAFAAPGAPTPPPRAERISRSDRGERGERSDRGEHSDRGERGERSDRGEHSDRGERGQRSDRGEHSDRGERGQRSDRGERDAQRERSDRAEHSARGERNDRGERSARGRSDRSERSDRGERADRSPRDRESDSNNGIPQAADARRERRDRDSDLFTQKAEVIEAPAVADTVEKPASKPDAKSVVDVSTAKVEASATKPDTKPASEPDMKPVVDVGTAKVEASATKPDVTSAPTGLHEEDKTEVAVASQAESTPDDSSNGEGETTKGSYGRSKRRVPRR